MSFNLYVLLKYNHILSPLLIYVGIISGGQFCKKECFSFNKVPQNNYNYDL